MTVRELTAFYNAANWASGPGEPESSLTAVVVLEKKQTVDDQLIQKLMGETRDPTDLVAESRPVLTNAF